MEADCRVSAVTSRIVPNHLPSTWETRDYRVLLAAAEMLDRTGGGPVEVTDLSSRTNLSEEDVIRAVVALDQGDYIHARVERGMGGGLPWVIATGLTDRGRRAVGLWPSSDSGEALVAALFLAAEQAQSQEDKSRLRRAAESLGGVGRDLMVEVTAAFLARSAGM